MALIYETPNFTVSTSDRPFVDRTEGGQVRIDPKSAFVDRTQLPPELAIEYMKLSMVVGEAMKSALGRRGIDIGIINYQDMGNWGIGTEHGPHLHMYIFGRAKTATKQKYGEAVQLPRRETGFYDGFKPFNEQDIAELKIDIEKLLKADKYKSM